MVANGNQRDDRGDDSVSNLDQKGLAPNCKSLQKPSV